MDKLLTIVVPVYKVEPYINKCLDSLVLEDRVLMNQLEVIIVNDGTPDRSAEMSREYVKRFPDTFRQIDKKNGGHGSAWNVGLKEATGKYLRFLDSDDWLTNLGMLMNGLENCDADLVFTKFTKHYVSDGKEVTSDLVFPASDHPIAIDAEKWGEPSEAFNYWSVSYKASLLKPLYPVFAENVMYDDYILTWVPLALGRTYAAFDFVLYNYLIGRSGQSVSEVIRVKRAVSYWACFQKFEEMRLRIEGMRVPKDYLKTIDDAIGGYASFIFWYLSFLPYSDAKRKTSYLMEKYLHNNVKSSVIARYQMFPFSVYYILEHIRAWMQC